jgi:hypothetical protein
VIENQRLSNCIKAAAFLALWMFATPLFGLTLEELRHDPKLTPQRFARYFRNFEYQYHAELQAPAAFLASQSGDCDDFATLAATVLSEKGYTTRLVTIRMPGIVHVVCYVAETQCYLDYNNRDALFPTVHSNGTLADIARKVARSLDSRWTSSSEFIFQNGVERILTTVTEDGPNPPSIPLQLAHQSRREILVNF